MDPGRVAREDGAPAAPREAAREARYNPTLLTHHFSATFRPFCAVFSPFFRGFRLPGAKTERTGEKWRKMGEIWGSNGREIAVAKERWGLRPLALPRAQGRAGRPQVGGGGARAPAAVTVAIKV